MLKIYHLIYAPLLALVILVLILASIGASLGIREMYVKALLKIFEYATNIKKEKESCEELVKDDEIKNEFEKRKQIARLTKLRHESFMLRKSESIDYDTSELRGDLSCDDDINNDDNSNENDRFNADMIANDCNNNRSMFDKLKTKMGFQTSRSRHTSLSENDKYNHVHTPSNTHKHSQPKQQQHDFQLGDIIEFVNKGINTIIDDDVTKRFTTEELTVWNLLTRTNQQYEYVSFRVTVLWFLGFILRYFVLFPFRLMLFFLACGYTFVLTYMLGLLPECRPKKWFNHHMMMILHRILSRVFSAIITFHNRENKAKNGSICVANHTSPIDVIILSTDNVYSLIGQQHGGFTGWMQKAFSRASKHIWFDRSQSKDRAYVAKMMRDHAQDKDSSPILIFPEGTCINNTSVMMFKKGCFELGATIYPVAIKYDPRFGDAFWNSHKHSMLQYLILMMTSWAIVVDVYYLPAMTKRDDEDVLQFTNRVKAEIVKKGSFVDLNWDGMLKRTSPKLDLMYEQQQKYVSQLKIE